MRLDHSLRLGPSANLQRSPLGHDTSVSLGKSPGAAADATSLSSHLSNLPSVARPQHVLIGILPSSSSLLSAPQGEAVSAEDGVKVFAWLWDVGCYKKACSIGAKQERCILDSIPEIWQSEKRTNRPSYSQPMLPNKSMHESYSLTPVFGNVDEELRREVFNFWKANQAIGNPDEAWRRTMEVAIVIRNAAGELVGVSTVYVTLYANGLPYYFYRTFVRPQDRFYEVAHRTLAKTRQLLETLEISNKPNGMVIVAENQKLMRKGMRKYLERQGFTLEGWSAAGEGVWRYDFRKED